MLEAKKGSRIICVFVLTLESVFAVMDYCRNHTFDRPADKEGLHFSKENSDVEFGIYDKFKCLHCCTHGYRSIEWFKDGKPYPWLTNVSTFIIYPESGNQTIYSQELTTVDSGRYWCIASNDTHFLRHEVFLQTSGPSISMGWPRSTYRPRDQTVDLGKPTRFYCEAFVGTINLPDFESEITWERYDHNRSFIDGDKVNQENIFREEKRVLGSYLIFKEVRQEDFGEYTCKVRNLGDQTVKLSARLLRKPEIKLPQHKNNKERFRLHSSFLLIILLVLSAVMSTLTFLHLGSYIRTRRKKGSEMTSSGDIEKDLLVIYHEKDAREVLKVVVPAIQKRYHYSCSLHLIHSASQLGEEDLKAKANSYRAILALISPSLVGGSWSCKNIYDSIEALLKVHFTIICVFLLNLPASNSMEENLMRNSLSKVHFVEGYKKKDCRFWENVKLKLFVQKRNTALLGSLEELV